MAAISAANVSYVIAKKSVDDQSNTVVDATVSFGNGVLTYPANGIPLTPGNLACPNVIDALMIEGAQGAAFSYQYDPVHQSVRIFQTGAALSGPLAELTGAATPAATTLNIRASGH